MKQKIITLILVCCTSLPLAGQSRHEFSVNAGGGLSTLSLKLSDGKSTSGFGIEAGLGYHFFLSPKWSIGTGINLALYNSEASIGKHSKTIDARTMNNTSFKFFYEAVNYKDEISAMMLTIPLMLQFQSNGKIKLYVAGGGKIGLPLSANYKTSINQLETKCNLVELGVLIEGDLPKYGFTKYQGVNQKADMKLDLAFMLSGEAGLKWQLGSMNLYTGAYIDYGLNDVRKDKPTSLLDYNGSATSYPSGFIYNGMANGLSSKVSAFAIGVKIRLQLNSSLIFKKTEKKKEE